MYCRVCGDDGETVKYRSGKHQSLCRWCNRDTPRKVTREEFERVYWAGPPGIETVPHSTRRDFWEDYLASECTLAEYVEQTTTRNPS
jgi:hypothetical protein